MIIFSIHSLDKKPDLADPAKNHYVWHHMMAIRYDLEVPVLFDSIIAVPLAVTKENILFCCMNNTNCFSKIYRIEPK